MHSIGPAAPGIVHDGQAVANMITEHAKMTAHDQNGACLRKVSVVHIIVCLETAIQRLRAYDGGWQENGRLNAFSAALRMPPAEAPVREGAPAVCFVE